MTNYAPDMATLLARCPYTSSFYSFLGIAIAIGLACLGSAYGTAKAGKGVVAAGVMKPQQAMKNSLPVIMAGILGIYGLIIGIVISTTMGGRMKAGSERTYSLYDAFAHLSSGISVGLSSLAAGIAIGISGNAGARANARNPKLFVVMLLILVFGEALALYGVILGLIIVFSGPTVDYC